ncbi:MAG: hypothetical protein E7678_01595 [Ruminococcaceae bacterium]|nr:hypothetical protein [Oscillospiraceae bacterium]
MKSQTKRIIISAVLTLIFAFIVFYLTLPAINLQSTGFWLYLFSCIVFYFASSIIIKIISERKTNKSAKVNLKLKKNRKTVISGLILALPLLVLAIGSLISSTLFNANAYSTLIEVPEANFAEDMPENDVVSNIALMDTDTAIQMGNRTLGALSDVVSQYEISENYKQINYQKKPQKISTLEYADFFKWFSNKESGIPGYVMVDPVNVTDAKYIKLEKPIKYTQSGCFGDDLMRKLRFSYPTKIFGNCSFEIDEEGNPYYVVACMKPRIALFGASDVNEVIIFDPVSGSSTIHSIEETPSWVDNVFTGELASQKYDWYGTLKNGYWNSVIGNKDCKVTTDDYGYIVIEDDVWFFTGVTSVVSDESNIGFIISNARTGEYKFYQVSGAEEYSAMSSAQGQVQEKGYVASFPSLINVSGEATYIMVLKDSAGLVKLYALVNVENYAIVATGTTQTEAKEEYLKLLKREGIIDKIPEKEEIQNSNIAEIVIEISDIRVYTVGGESVFYITSAEGQIYSQKLCDENRLLIIKNGDKLKVKYKTDDADGGNGLIREITDFDFVVEEGTETAEESSQNA